MIDLEEILPHHFDPASRVWIYQSSRLFLLSEVFAIEEMLKQFTESWQSHGTPVKGFATLLYGQFIVLMADETTAGVSGCSTDSSVRLIKQIEQQCSVQLFDRLSLAFLVNDKVQLLPLSQLAYAVSNGFIKGDTLYFNNTVLTKQEMLRNWLVPVQKSWLAAKAGLPAIQ
jgi:hypothetical protein